MDGDFDLAKEKVRKQKISKYFSQLPLKLSAIPQDYHRSGQPRPNEQRFAPQSKVIRRRELHSGYQNVQVVP